VADAAGGFEEGAVSSNPVLGQDPWRQNAAASPYQGQYSQPQWQGGQVGGHQQAPPTYGAPVAAATDRMTIDDVVMKTLTLLGVVLVSGAAAWTLLPAPVAGLALFGALGVGLILGLVIAFKQVTNPAVILTYAVAEGVLLGLVSKVYESLYSGIVLQAVVATFSVFAGMAALYKFKVIRATPKFTRWLSGAVLGLFGLMIVNFGLSLFGVNGGAGLGLRAGVTGEVNTLAIVFSLVCIGVAALTFIQDFAVVEEGVARGVERRYGWYASFGILVGLIWLYLEILRLLSYLRR
jgi:uncharacterized YccA/Bax inhibitor family protein